MIGMKPSRIHQPERSVSWSRRTVTAMLGSSTASVYRPDSSPRLFAA